jgi:Putative  PD-(D/E)XK family member, (DUF4420)
VKAADLERVWAGVETSEARGGVLAGRPAPEASVGDAVLAVDGAGRRHLLVPAGPDDTEPKQPATKGLEARIDELRVGSRPERRYFDVACRETSLNANFATVAAEILAELEHDDASRREAIDRVLARWRWFWGVPPGALSQEGAVGLFAELWFLEHWLAPLDRDVVEAWAGPLGERHDVRWEAASVEVKATAVSTDGAAVHRITSLDQLTDPVQGVLHLFSMRVTPDAMGQHSLNRSVDRLSARLAAQPEVLLLFEERLARVGYSPAQRELYDDRLRVRAEELYRVEGAFPRLTAAAFAGGLPPGVDHLTYTLDLAACAPWRVATAPGTVSKDLRATLGG